MNIFSNKFINLFSLIITIIIFLIINFTIKISSKKINSEINQEKIISENFEENENTKLNKNNEENNEETSQENNNSKINIGEENWYIEISSINLKAPIKETTETEILNTFVGHFEETSKTLGNIGLAGHNRGYDYNYFENLKSVKIGDEIIYNYKDFNKKYKIDKIEIIKETNWSYLEETKENKITLITCVENKPNYRRCVQATEVI